MSRHKPHLDPATGAPLHPLPQSSADIVERMRQQAGITRAWHGYELGDLPPAAISYLVVAECLADGAREIERLRDACKRATQAVSRLTGTPAQPMLEPAAWQVQGSRGDWQHIPDSLVGNYRKAGNNVRPLYASQPSPAAPVDDGSMHGEYTPVTVRASTAPHNGSSAGNGGDFCTYGPPAERKRRWIILFDDPDKGTMVFDDEKEAHAAWDRAKDNWTCTLFETSERKYQWAAGQLRPLNEPQEAPVTLTSAEKGLLEWLSKDDGQYGECHGKTLDRLIELGLAKVGGADSGIKNGFIAKGASLMYRAVSITDKGRTTLALPRPQLGGK